VGDLADYAVAFTGGPGGADVSRRCGCGFAGASRIVLPQAGQCQADSNRTIATRQTGHDRTANGFTSAMPARCARRRRAAIQERPYP
jgi:hypothetical protein